MTLLPSIALPSGFLRAFPFVLLAALALPNAVRSDPAIPGSVLAPKTAAEAWNVIRLATTNVDLLLAENRLAEIPVQISYCRPALRELRGMLAAPDSINVVRTQVTRAFTSINAIATAATQKNPGGVRSALAGLRSTLENLARHYDPTVVSADVFSCPMHADVLADNAKTPCAKCGMGLLSRRIPASFIYTNPGEPSVHITATTSAPVEAGTKLDVRLRLEKADQSPLVYADLIEMHTQRIHLLIEEPGLGDYHHEHPVPTDIPGDYTFSFTPRKSSPYRIWADIVPVATGTQELPFVDLPSAGKAGAIADTANRLTASTGGHRFTLAFTQGNSLPPKAGETRPMGITVTDSTGRPVTNLEPVMNAFAHLVGFYDDYRTLVHLHPTGGDVLNPEARGGPTLGFILFPPKAGFIRLYCQVSIGGRMLFAPFNLNVAP